MAKISFKLVSPSKNLLSVETDMVIIPGSNGDMGIMAGHSPVISTVRAGEIIVRDSGKDVRWFVEGGFVEVSATCVTVLAEVGILSSDINKADAQTLLVTAESELAKADSRTVKDKSQNAVNIAKARLRAVETPAYG